MFEFLVDMGPRAGAPFTGAALSLAKRLNAFVTGAQVLPAQPQVALSFEKSLLEAEQRSALARREWWLGQCAAAGVAGEWEVLRGEPAPALARRSRLADMLWLEVSVVGGARDAQSPEPTRTLLQAAAPVMLVPSAWQGAVARRVVVEWDGSVAAASVIRSALPVLAQAGDVHVLDSEQACLPGITPSPLPLRAWLKRHGIEPQWRSVDPDRDSESFDEIAAGLRADLVVMSAWEPPWSSRSGRSGTRRHLFGHIARPMLLSH